MMKKGMFDSLIVLGLVAFFVSGCCRSPDVVWDDTRSAGRHMSRGLRSLGGKQGDSRQVRCREDFLQSKDGNYCIEDFQSMEFEPLPDQDYSSQIPYGQRNRDVACLQPSLHEYPTPGIDSFQDPGKSPYLSSTFANISFPYNTSLVKGQENMHTVHAIAAYMRQHPNTRLYIEGHCDERGAEAYNLSLGARRSNSVRNLLIKEGVNPENIFTVSYGKERPIDPGHSEAAWSKNRRTQFKIYQR